MVVSIIKFDCKKCGFPHWVVKEEGGYGIPKCCWDEPPIIVGRINGPDFSRIKDKHGGDNYKKLPYFGLDGKAND